MAGPQYYVVWSRVANNSFPVSLIPEEVPNLRDVRLVDGTGNFSGRLETYYFQLDNILLPLVWGTVCSTGFDYHEGDLVCQQLGFQSSYRVGTVHELGYVIAIAYLLAGGIVKIVLNYLINLQLSILLVLTVYLLYIEGTQQQ